MGKKTLAQIDAEIKKRQEYEDQEYEEISECVRDGYCHGITSSGSTWVLAVNFEYPEGCGR